MIIITNIKCFCVNILYFGQNFTLCKYKCLLIICNIFNYLYIRCVVCIILTIIFCEKGG